VSETPTPGPRVPPDPGVSPEAPVSPDPRALPEPGSLAQEAALLAVAMREWLTSHGGPPTPGQPADQTEPPSAGWPATADDDGPSTADEGWAAFGPDGEPADPTPGPAGPGGPAGAAAAGHPFAGWDGPAPGASARTGPPWAVRPGETLCTGCPLCRLLATVGGSHAEVLGHLLAAASALTAAARAAWPPGGVPGQGTGAPPGGPQASPRPTATQRTRPARDRVQRIDIGD